MYLIENQVNISSRFLENIVQNEPNCAYFYLFYLIFSELLHDKIQIFLTDSLILVNY